MKIATTLLLLFFSYNVSATSPKVNCSGKGITATFGVNITDENYEDAAHNLSLTKLVYPHRIKEGLYKIKEVKEYKLSRFILDNSFMSMGEISVDMLNRENGDYLQIRALGSGVEPELFIGAYLSGNNLEELTCRFL